MMAHALGAPGFPYPTVRSNGLRDGSGDGQTTSVEGRRLQQTHTGDRLERTVS